MSSLLALHNVIGGFIYPFGIAIFLACFASLSFCFRREGRAVAAVAWEIRLLSHLAALTPTLGLLGTLWGLITGLSSVNPAEPATAMRLLNALGLSMSATFLGLGISFGAQGMLLFFEFVSSRVNGTEGGACARQ